MDASDLRAVLKKEEFEPVRVFVNDGRRYDIRRREQTMVTQNWLHIGISRNGAEPYDTIDSVWNGAVERLAPLVRQRARKRKV